MRKLVAFLCITMILLSISTTVFAGSIPEDLLHSDDAQIFFAEVISYDPNKKNPDIEVMPTKVIKGDVKTAKRQVYQNPNPVGLFRVTVGKVYLFTYFDKNNPTDIFDVTSYDTSKLKLKNTTGEMWERFEKYLNEGRYLDAEHERIDRKNNELVVVGGKTLTLTEFIGADKNGDDDVSIYYSSGLDTKVMQIDRAKFFEVADTIVCNEIVKTDNANVDGFFAVADDDCAVYISYDGKVSKNNPMHSFVAQAEYKFNSHDLAKFERLMEEKSLSDAFVDWVIWHPTEVKTIGILLFVVVVGVIVVIIRHKSKRKGE